MNSQAIGFIDSGVGGLTVVKEALRQLPHENVIFLGDQARLPYGPRPADQVVEFTWQMTHFMLEKKIKMLVIACNTATAAALDIVRSALDIPVIGVIVPGAQAALQHTRNGRVGVIATEGTVRSGAYPHALHQKSTQVEVTSLAAPKFVPLVESNEMHTSVAKRVVAETLQPLVHSDIDTLILGCTHYPLLRPLIENVMGDRVTLIDSGAETVSSVSLLLDYFDLNNTMENQHPRREFYTTGSGELFDEIAGEWLGMTVKSEHVRIDQYPTHAPQERTIVVASTNRGKVAEIGALFASEGIAVKSLADFTDLPDVEETGTTFEENARLKADQYAAALRLPVIADDSGLMVDALGGQPGVYSARYAGDAHNDAANNAKLIANLADVPADQRQAAFQSTLVLAWPNRPADDLVVTGSVQGMIVGVPQGENGFGYDPYFFVPEMGKTMAELTTAEKNTISHRGNAMRALKPLWRKWFEKEAAQ